MVEPGGYNRERRATVRAKAAEDEAERVQMCLAKVVNQIDRFRAEEFWTGVMQGIAEPLVKRGSLTSAHILLELRAVKHRALLSALKDAQGKGNASFEKAVTAAFEHVFEYLRRLNQHVSSGGPDGEERPLEDGESATLR